MAVDINALLKINPDDVVRRDLGRVSLAEVENEIKNTYALLRDVFTAPAGLVSQSMMIAFEGWGTEFLTYANQALTLDLARGDFHATRQNLVAYFRNLWNAAGQQLGLAFAVRM